MKQPETGHGPNGGLELVEAVDIAENACDDVLVLRDLGRVGEGLFEWIGCGHCDGMEIVVEEILVLYLSQLSNFGEGLGESEIEGCMKVVWIRRAEVIVT